MGCLALRQGDDEVIDEVFHYWRDDGITHGVVGLVVGGGEAEFFGGSHKPGGFSGGDETSIPLTMIVKDEELAAAASFGGAEAT